MSLERIKLFISPVSTVDAETTDSDIKELLEYKKYLEKELDKVKVELRKKVQM